MERMEQDDAKKQEFKNGSPKSLTITSILQGDGFQGMKEMQYDGNNRI